MKKIYIFAALLISGNTLFAQSLSRTDIGYTAGENFSMYPSTTQTNPGTTGTGVTWDLSALTAGTPVAVTPSVNSGGTFPSANLKLTQSNGGVIYYNATSSVLDAVGIDANGTIFTYSNPATYLQFPVTTSQNYTDQFACTFTVSGYNFTRTGSTQTEFSGYGTLITPNGTYTNVVRLKSTQTITDVYSLGTINSTIISFNWYKAGVHHEVANVSATTSNGNTTYSNYYTTVPANLGLEENELVNLSVFPNPSTDVLHLNSDELISQVEFYTVSGELSLNHSMNESKTAEVNISSLNSGMYLVKVYGKDGSISVQRITKN
nr:T9SS type A sorting domain-containing protein [uncultured Fluviicola sp.]